MSRLALKLGSLDEVVRLNENEPGSKTERYFQRTKDGKLLLRRMMDRYIPETITTAEKQGFSAPDASWFKGESIDYVRRTLYHGPAAHLRVPRSSGRCWRWSMSISKASRTGGC